MFDYINFKENKAANSNYDLKLFELSTCGFCRRATEFLKKKELSYKYIHIDDLEPEIKTRLKKDIRENFDINLRYPTLIIENKEYLTGFISLVWEKQFKKLSKENG